VAVIDRPRAAPPRVLALRALGLGDLCAAVPALRALRRAFPTHELVLAAPEWQTPLARLAGVDRVVPTKGLAPLSEREAGPEVAVNLHGCGPQSTMGLLALRPQRLIAFRHPAVPLTEGQPRWSPHEHETARWCQLLNAHGIRADRAELRLAVPDVAAPVAPGAVVVHPGAGAPARRWPLERFATLVRALLGRGERVVVTGDETEVDIASHLVRTASSGDQDRVTNLAGRTTLPELCALVSGARAMVANDTGVAHLASAYGIPSVVLFGPTPPHEWGPPPGPHVAIWKGVRGDPHAREVDAGLAAIDVGEVLEAYMRVTADRTAAVSAV
jgi:ADP-heptose:LPS heptosyltransferase